MAQFPNIHPILFRMFVLNEYVTSHAQNDTIYRIMLIEMSLFLVECVCAFVCLFGDYLGNRNTLSIHTFSPYEFFSNEKKPCLLTTTTVETSIQEKPNENVEQICCMYVDL